MIEKWSKQVIKGEFVLLVPKVENTESTDPMKWIEHLEKVFGISKKEALLIAAKHLNLSRRELYNDMHQD